MAASFATLAEFEHQLVGSAGAKAVDTLRRCLQQIAAD
jgi:hypothetical protein